MVEIRASANTETLISSILTDDGIIGYAVPARLICFVCYNLVTGDMDEPCIKPSFDSLESNLEKTFAYITIGVESFLLVVTLWYLIKLLRKTFSYKKNGMYEAIEIHVVGMVALVGKRICTQLSSAQESLRFTPSTTNKRSSPPIPLSSR